MTVILGSGGVSAGLRPWGSPGRRTPGHTRQQATRSDRLIVGAGVRRADGSLAIRRSSTYVGHVSKARGPMREPTYFVLASLLDGPLYGYAIIQRTGELSGSRVRLATGTLYTALDRFTAEGYVELVREEIVNGRVRRSYGLTPPGAGALRAEAARMADAAKLVTDRGRDLKAGPARKTSPA